MVKGRVCRLVLLAGACLLTASFTTSEIGRQTFESVWRTVNETHFDPTFGGRDWQAIGDRHRPRILAAGSPDERHRRLNEMLFELGLSHLLVVDPEELKRRLPTFFAEGSVGLDLRYLAGAAVVTAVRRPSPAAEAGIRPGTIVTRVDGVAVEEIVALTDSQLIPPFNARNRLSRIGNEILGRIDGAADTAVSLTTVDGAGVERQATMRRASRGNGQVLSKALPPQFVEFAARRLEGGIAYVTFNNFAAPADRAFIDTLASLGEAPGLVIDVRGNPGGYLNIAHGMARHLVKDKASFARFRLRDRRIERVVEPVKDAYRGPVVVLVDTLSTSASEYFAGCLQALGRVTVIGERTPGYMLGAEWTRLPDGAAFMHAFVEPSTADGIVLEGRGVIPDVEVGLDRDSLLAGRDLQLEAAVQLIMTSSGR